MTSGKPAVPSGCPHRGAVRKVLLGAAAVLLWLSGPAACAPSMPVPSLPEGISPVHLRPGPQSSFLAWHPSGGKLALADEGLRVINLETGKEALLGEQAPAALAWSPDGKRLAAAFVSGGSSRLRILTMAGGPEQEVALAGRVEALFWPRAGEILATAVSVETFSFGANFRSLLYRWDLAGSPTAAVLAETTLKPLTRRRLEEKELGFPPPVLSSDGEFLLFTRLHDPPARTPYLKVVLRHLENGAELEQGEAAAYFAGLTFAGSEEILFGDGRGETLKINPWTGHGALFSASPGRLLAASPGGTYVLIDGHLLLQGEEVAVLPGIDGAWFAPRGGNLLVRRGDSFLVLGGLEEEMGPSADGRLRLLRRWRTEGLISAEEYVRYRQRIAAP